MLHQVTRFLEDSQKKPAGFDVLQLIELRDHVFRAEDSVHGFAVRAKHVRVWLHCEDVLPSDPMPVSLLFSKYTRDRVIHFSCEDHSWPGGVDIRPLLEQVECDARIVENDDCLSEDSQRTDRACISMNQEYSSMQGPEGHPYHRDPCAAESAPNSSGLEMADRADSQ